MNERRVALRLPGFLLATLVAVPATAQFAPPPCTGSVFNDVNCSGLFDAWVEQYAADQITGGCGGGNYCPNSPVTRGQMAVFVEKAMRGTASWYPGDRGSFNTGLGESALLNNSAMLDGNTAIGSGALEDQSFDNGGVPMTSANTAVGRFALASNQPTTSTNGIFNTAVGAVALGNNLTGYANTALGFGTMILNFTGWENTAVGADALNNNNGFRNTAVGRSAGARSDTITGYLGTDVTLVPTSAGSYNTFVSMAGATSDVSNCTAVGMDAYCVANDQVRLGNFFVNSIGGKVDWSTLSDARAKEDVRDLEAGLPLVLALRPVSYRYKAGNGRADLGFVAQDVEALLGEDYNVVDAGGDVDRTLSLRYAQLIAPLVKAVQEQQAQIEALRAEIAALKGIGD